MATAFGPKVTREKTVRSPASAPASDAERGSPAGWPLFLEGEGGAPSVQPKLIVGPPDDEYEREADRVADVVGGGAGAPLDIPPGSRRSVPHAELRRSGPSGAAVPPASEGLL